MAAKPIPKPEATATPPKAEDKNLYTDIFQKKSKVEEKAQAPKETALIEGVMDKKAKELKPEEKILGDMPELEKKIVGAFDPTKRNLKIVRALFFFIVAISLIAIGAFYTELNPEFDLLSSIRGQNTAQQLNNVNLDIVNVQTSINQKNYLLMAYYLQELSYLADTYNHARTGGAPDDELAEIQDNILLAYENAQTKFKEPMKVANIPADDFYKALKGELKKELSLLKSETSTKTIEQEIAVYSTAQNLANNKELTKFFAISSDDVRANLPDDDSLLLELTNTALEILDNEFSKVSLIKNSRVRWSVIIEEIEKITKGVDTLYNKGFYEELGGIEYGSYNFNADTNRIVLLGEVKKDDGTTFTLVANLLDALEQSLIFSDVDDRSYPRQGSEEDGYTTSFKIDLQLADDYLTNT